MRHLPVRWGGIGSILGICLLLGAVQAAPAQQVAISFNDYHGYTGTVDYLKKVAAAYPDITELVEIGKSYQNRSLYTLVISNMKIGTTIDKHVPLRNMRNEPNTQTVVPMKPYQGKPGIWIDGGTHGNEFTGTEVCLYTIDKLLSGYGTDAEITQLIDQNTFYICPIVNPDGVFNSVEAGLSQRQNSPEPSEAGGAVSSAPRDVNGDGVISQFRYKDPAGRYVEYDGDPRVMVTIPAGETTTKERYSVIREGQARAGAGTRGSGPQPSPQTRGARGIDVNRNFPEGWFRDDGFQGGSGAYPSSSPEAHAILEFFANHTNILMAQSFHTSGGFTYRPMARYPDSRMDPKDLAIYDRVMGRKYLELRGEEVPAAWLAPAPTQGRAAAGGSSTARGGGAGTRGRGAAAPAVQGRAGARGGAAAPAARGPQGWRHPYNEEQRSPYGYGIFLDWAYAEFGAYSLSTELWNWQRDSKGLPGYNGENDRALWESAYIKYQEQELGGKAFLAWKPFNHPGVGDGEIGGWIAKYTGGNAIPGQSLLALCDTHYQFEIFRAKLLPRVEISNVNATVLYTTDTASAASVEQQGDTFSIRKGNPAGKFKVVKVIATVKNAGELATHTADGAALAGNRSDAVWLIGDRDKITYLSGSPWTSIGVLEGVMTIPGYTPPAASSGAAGGRGRGGGRGGGGRGAPGAPAQNRRQAPTQQQVTGTGNSREITWLVAVEGDAPLKVVLTSQKGGTVVREVTLK